jgi:hypothetical protein
MYVVILCLAVSERVCIRAGRWCKQGTPRDCKKLAFFQLACSVTYAQSK